MTSNNKPRRGALCTRPIVNPDPLELVHRFQGFRGGRIPASGIRLSGIPPSGIAELRIVMAVPGCARTKISKRRVQQSSLCEQVFRSVPFAAPSSDLSEGETATGLAFVAEYPTRTISKTERDCSSSSRCCVPVYLEAVYLVKALTRTRDTFSLEFRREINELEQETKIR
jgi:hypothetical protein